MKTVKNFMFPLLGMLLTQFSCAVSFNDVNGILPDRQMVPYAQPQSLAVSEDLCIRSNFHNDHAMEVIPSQAFIDLAQRIVNNPQLVETSLGLGVVVGQRVTTLRPDLRVATYSGWVMTQEGVLFGAGRSINGNVVQQVMPVSYAYIKSPAEQLSIENTLPALPEMTPLMIEAPLVETYTQPEVVSFASEASETDSEPTIPEEVMDAMRKANSTFGSEFESEEDVTCSCDLEAMLGEVVSDISDGLEYAWNSLLDYFNLS